MLELITVVGTIAGSVAILGYVPQIHKSQKSKSMKEVSTLLLMLFTLSSFLWTVYGFHEGDYVLGGLSMITFSLGTALISMKIVYEKKHESLVFAIANSLPHFNR